MSPDNKLVSLDIFPTQIKFHQPKYYQMAQNKIWGMAEKASFCWTWILIHCSGSNCWPIALVAVLRKIWKKAPKTFSPKTAHKILVTLTTAVQLYFRHKGLGFLFSAWSSNLLKNIFPINNTKLVLFLLFLRHSSEFEPSCHMPFTQAIATLHCFSESLTFFTTNIINSKMQCQVENTCVWV